MAAPPGERPARRPRIAVTGSAGVGKTTLGRGLAERLGVPFLNEGMRTRLEAGLELHTLSPDAFRALLTELFDEMVDGSKRAVAQAGGFVGDRCAIDVAAFWLYYGFGSDVAATERICERAQTASALYDLVVVLPWGAIPLADDGVRTPNRWLQLHYQTVLEGLVERWMPPSAIERIGADVIDDGSRIDRVVRRLAAGDPA